MVLVDTYEPSRRLAPAFQAVGFTPVRVQSTTATPKLYEGHPDPFPYTVDITHRGDVEGTVRALASYAPVAVVAGGELGVNLADELSAAFHPRFGTPTNGTASSAARRDKYLMVERVKERGLAGAEQILVEDERRLLEWHTRLGRRIILKPLRSAAGDGVVWCDTPEDSLAAYRRLSQRENVFSQLDGIVAQEYLTGAEYLVNTVSRDGRHQVCDVWKTHRISVNGVPDLPVACHLLPAEGPLQDRLVEYATAVLDALDIRHGPAHVEVKMTPRGPVIIEVGARISGLDLPGRTELATGRSQIQWTVDAYVRPERFREHQGTPYRADRGIAWAAMASPYSGRLLEYRGLERIKELESFQDLRLAVRPGDRIEATVDDSTYPLTVSLMHEVDEIVLRDLRTLRYLDGAGFYSVAPETAGGGS